MSPSSVTVRRCICRSTSRACRWCCPRCRYKGAARSSWFSATCAAGPRIRHATYAPLIQVEGPELVAIDARLEPVAVLACPVRARSSHRRLVRSCRTRDPFGEVDAGDAHHPAMLHRILDGHRRSDESRLIVGRVEAAESAEADAHLAEAFLEIRQIPLVDLREVLGLEDQDLVAEEIQQLAVWREQRGWRCRAPLRQATEWFASPCGGFEVELLELSLADLDAIAQLWCRCVSGESRIYGWGPARARTDADAPVAFGERERCRASSSTRHPLTSTFS